MIFCICSDNLLIKAAFKTSLVTKLVSEYIYYETRGVAVVLFLGDREELEVCNNNPTSDISKNVILQDPI